MIDIIQQIVLVRSDACNEFLKLVGIVAFSVLVSIILIPHLCRAWDKASRHSVKVFLAFCALATMYAGAKHIGRIEYPFTDPEVRYLTDHGSYVTNDYVHIDFTRNLLVPSSATLYVDGCDIQWTNDIDKAAHMFTAYASSFSVTTVPFDLPYAAATNYNWYVYTDWVPPPVVHTNGVAYISWQIGIGKATNDLAMTRTGVYRDSLRIAPNPSITNAPAFPASIMQQPVNDQSSTEDN